MPGFNQGRACDAIIRRIEARLGRQRGPLQFPEREPHPAPVELVCDIGEQRFAFEHTGIEPFEGMLEMEATAKRHLDPIISSTAVKVPAGQRYILAIPAGATLGLKGNHRGNIQRCLADWIIATAPALPEPEGHLYSGSGKQNVPGVPFEVSLRRVAHGPEPIGLSIIHSVGHDLEGDRVQRIRRAYDKKMPKLLHWQQQGARAVLILEENDIQLTNHWTVAAAISQIESERSERPDEIYLVSTVLDSEWTSWLLRTDDKVSKELSVWGDALQYIDPATLNDITAR